MEQLSLAGGIAVGFVMGLLVNVVYDGGRTVVGHLVQNEVGFRATVLTLLTTLVVVVVALVLRGR